MLKLLNVRHTFASAYEPVLNGISLTLSRGEFCVLIGSNGSGKSTLMRLISGQYPLTHGKIYFDGQAIAHQQRSQFVASVVQDVNQGTILEMTLLENMVLSLTRGQRGRLSLYQSYQKEAMTYLCSLGIGLEKSIHEPLSSLSGGQRQMVATLMALHAKPKVLLLDEHTSALDPKMQAILMQYTNQAIIDNQMTSMMITHKLDDAIQYGNRLIMLYKGQIVFDVSGEEKARLSVAALLALFHRYEDLSLTDEAAS
jgi:putative tryptophan/tyrosine transport system ATP-binding protein